jgi:hypothetical protein
MKKILVLLALLVTMNVTWAQKYGIVHDVKVTGSTGFWGNCSRVDAKLQISRDTTVLDNGKEYTSWRIFINCMNCGWMVDIDGLAFEKQGKMAGRTAWAYTNRKAYQGIESIVNYFEVISTIDKLSERFAKDFPDGGLIIQADWATSELRYRLPGYIIVTFD